jgi:hypothetical protein
LFYPIFPFAPQRDRGDSFFLKVKKTSCLLIILVKKEALGWLTRAEGRRDKEEEIFYRELVPI